MRSDSKDVFEFGPFRVDARERVVLRAGAIVPLTLKAFDLLLALVEARGHVLTKDALMKRVWPDSFVEEANLSHHIYKLREALGEQDGQTCIQTVPRRGYRFAVPVTVRHEAAGDDASPARPVVEGDAPVRPTVHWGDREVALGQGPALLGRGPNCVIRIDSVLVSREHARVVVTVHEARLEDLSSKNGTFLNGMRITAPVVLTDGDEIRIGAVPLKFHCSGALPSTRTIDGVS